MTGAPPDAIEFRVDRDMIGMKHGVLREEGGRRIVLVSQALYSLLQTDRDLVLPGLMVVVPGESVERWVMDLLEKGE